MKMNRLTKAGMLIIVIGFSVLAGTLYRGTTAGSGFNLSTGLDPENVWSTPYNDDIMSRFGFSYFLIPTDYRLEIKFNMTVDVYILDSEGKRLWLTQGTLEPVQSYESVKEQTTVFHIEKRDNYVLLVHNPSGKSVGGSLTAVGYGVETDLLYASLGIIVLGAIVTAVSFIPKRNSNRKQSTATKSTAISAAMLALIILSLPIAVCTAQSNSLLAPNWMKEGTYASYDLTPHGMSYTNGVLDTSKSMTVYFLNNTMVKHNNVTSASLRWECINLNGDMATLNLTYTINSDLPSDNFYTSALVDVNIASRSVYLQNGTLIGTTNLWLPSSPADGQEVTLWDVPPDKVTANINTKMPNGDNIWTSETPQSAQTAFQLVNVAGTIDGKDLSQVGGFMGHGMYEYDTGIMLQGDLTLEPMHLALGINLYDGPSSMTTNVDMGTVRTVIDWSYWLSIAAVVGAIILIAVLMVVRHRRRK